MGTGPGTRPWLAKPARQCPEHAAAGWVPPMGQLLGAGNATDLRVSLPRVPARGHGRRGQSLCSSVPHRASQRLPRLPSASSRHLQHPERVSSVADLLRK